MSTLVADNARATNGGAAFNIVRGVYSSFVTLEYTGGAVLNTLRSYNVSSMVDNGASDYTANWTNAYDNFNSLGNGSGSVNGTSSSTNGVLITAYSRTTTDTSFNPMDTTTDVLSTNPRDYMSLGCMGVVA